ncbi:putative RNA-directed DNA polymerase from transposon X-element [Toxocara canis]|uniref:Putative RNA-directed DNA polymerase from transposon X-element n=1 Tax=Toxocara canis TaxID=6265 RepID=A0A0B2V650_TOXCA|nr:putative RNA-directed DNA polymerase from transposon X-element [Toxocara canis]
MLKTAKNFVATKLLSLFNTIIQNGEFIEEWKEAKIRAIFKNTGSEQEPANYRPISLLSCVSKLFERCIHPQIYQALEPFLPNCQRAFRKRHSITTALAEICEKILLNMENNNLAYIVQLDVKKAYDTVNPYILLGTHVHCHKLFNISRPPVLKSAYRPANQIAPHQPPGTR